MRGATAGDTEVFGCADDARPNQVLPHAVGHHASCERIAGAGYPIGKLHATGGVTADARRIFVQNLHKSARYGWSWLSHFAAFEQANVGGA